KKTRASPCAEGQSMGSIAESASAPKERAARNRRRPPVHRGCLVQGQDRPSLARLGRDLPERFGPWKSVYNRFANWASKKHWAAIFRELKFELDETSSIVDGSVIRAHQDSSGGKGGSNAMLWAALEEGFRQSSMPSSTRKAARSTFTLTPGQRHEMTVAEELL